MNCWIILLLLFGCGNRSCGCTCENSCENSCENVCGNQCRERCVHEHVEERSNCCSNRASECASRVSDCANARPATWNDCDCDNDFPRFNRCDTCGCENN